MAIQIFENQTVDAVKTGSVKANGIYELLIFGVLDGADFKTSKVDDDGNKIVIADLSWLSSKGEVLTIDGDGANKYLSIGDLSFDIVNSGASTDLTVQIDHDSASFKLDA